MQPFYLFFLFSIIYILIPIIKIIILDKLDNNTLFLLLTNYILLFGIIIFYALFITSIYPVILALFLMISSFFLLRDLKRQLHYYQLLSVPYFLITIYIFSYTLTNLAY